VMRFVLSRFRSWAWARAASRHFFAWVGAHIVSSTYQAARSYSGKALGLTKASSSLGANFAGPYGGMCPT
jgi:hypothetical protein